MPPWPIAMPSSTAMVLNSRPTPPAALTESATSSPMLRRCTWPGTNWVKLLAIATIGLPKSSSVMPVARQSARAPAMLRPCVVVRDRSAGMVDSDLQQVLDVLLHFSAHISARFSTLRQTFSHYGLYRSSGVRVVDGGAGVRRSSGSGRHRGCRPYYRRVAKSGGSGRGQGVTDLVDLAGGARRRGRIAGKVFLVIAALIAIPTLGFAALSSAGLVSAQADQDAYDKAPVCAAGVTNSHDCVLRTTAMVGWVDVTRNTGKSAHGYTTKADLKPAVGRSQTVTLSKSQDLTTQVTTGDEWPVVVWRDEITRYTMAGRTHDADENPYQRVAALLIGIPVCLAVGSLTGRVVLRRLLRARIAVNPARHRIPDWTLVVLSAATIVAAILRASWFVSGFALAAVVVLIGSAAVWPFLPWVRQPDPGSLLGRSQVRAARRAMRELP